jgi:hypothetical protein
VKVLHTEDKAQSNSRLREHGVTQPSTSHGLRSTRLRPSPSSCMASMASPDCSYLLHVVRRFSRGSDTTGADAYLRKTLRAVIVKLALPCAWDGVESTAEGAYGHETPWKV